MWQTVRCLELSICTRWYPLQKCLADTSCSDAASGSANDEADDSNTQALALMQSMLSAMPASMQAQAEQNMQQALHSSTAMPAASTLMGATAQRGAQLLQGMRNQLQQQQQQAHNRITTHYYHCDHLGTPLALTDANGQIVWAASLDPWGNVLDEYDPQGIGQPIRLPGQIHDRQTGLYYNRHRYYDPAMGRYITQDPIGIQGGINPSTYAESNPISNIDPDGLFFFKLTTFESTKRGMTLPDAVNAGQPFRDLTAPTIIGATSAPYVGAIGYEAASGLVACYKVPEKLFHYTTKEAANKISQEGVINVGKNNLYGKGVYATRFDSPILARIQGAANADARIIIQNTTGFKPTPFPGTFRTNGSPVKIN